ncbi:MAG: LPS export ABC transporter periplasmic protein LptC [Alphaproteobacteria bacterium]|nr:LPS export ABC transporter periplasmic protein LptC [Alphaproteobacteria bacterium]
MKTNNKAHALNFLRPRATRRAAKARDPRATRLVNRLRFWLPAIALLVIMALFVWPMLDPNKLASIAVKNIPDLVVQNLHFTGLDGNNRSYSLSAAKAMRAGEANLYDLENPEGEITLDGGAWLAGKARQGRYDQAARKLWLGGDVELFHDKGYQFTTEEAQVDMKGYNAWGGKPVLIQGDFGEIRGQGFRMLDSGKSVVITGPARAVLNLHKQEGSDKPSGTKAKD